ncbi:MAG TPA: kelch repeat-containing protein [Bryobacteraceae bacterium]|nr:kelch repeat-containing protein [Bryobacteraceae bacterium]
MRTISKLVFDALCVSMSSSSIRQILVIATAAGCALGQSPGTFAAAGSMTAARSQHAAALLPDGRVLLTGGYGSQGEGMASAEIYDRSANAFTATASMSAPRRMHSSILLPDGRVLVVGGYSGSGPLATAEIYDPASSAFIPTGSLGSPRGGHTSILLSNGKVLILGGYGGPGYPEVAPAEIYDPDTGIFTPAAPYVGNGGCDFCAPSMQLVDGRVLFPQQNQPQLYDPATGTFSLTGSMIADQDAASLLMNGNVLFAGGENDFGRLPVAEIYDPVTGAFSSTGNMLSGRSWHTITLLPDGKVLAAGGETDSCSSNGCFSAGTLATAELYDPASGTFSPTGSMAQAREGHTATLLNDGRVLLAGGSFFSGINACCGTTASAELYTPTVLVPAPRLFSLSGDGKGQGAIWDATTGLVPSPVMPAVAGEILSMYTSGLSDGSVIPPQVSIGGSLAQILYFGDAPGWPGFFQVNFRVPNGIAPGSAAPVRLIYLERSSNEVTIAVQ